MARHTSRAIAYLRRRWKPATPIARIAPGSGLEPRGAAAPRSPQPMSQRPALLLALGVLAMTTPAHVSAAQNPRELGLVRWGRSLDAARAESRRTGRPVLLLFQ